ncbi:MAG: DUF1731 domain-containing protein [Opitutae bacterium]|nr:DUF1731 domain-containing protein [Opitutae bacterium]
MKIILAGGDGQVGRLLGRALARDRHECVVLTRRRENSRHEPSGLRRVRWDGVTVGEWAAELEGADVVINLAGRSVDCRYTEGNLAEMLGSRVDSTRVLGRAIAAAARPPRVWLQASTATIYAHRFDTPNDEATGMIGGAEAGVPALWGRSIGIAQAWERELFAAATPHTRRVALRSAMVMSPDRGGVFRVLAALCRCGLGRHGDGRQFVSWIHGEDFAHAVKFLLSRDDLAGVFNLAAPEPLPNREFIAAIHTALGSKLAVPLPRWALELGAFFLRTETELILKSRRVVPGRLLGSGFEFRFPSWPEAAKNLVAQTRACRNPLNPPPP